MAYGLKANTNNIVSSVNTMASQSPNGLTASPASFKAGRVKSIILDNNHPKFSNDSGNTFNDLTAITKSINYKSAMSTDGRIIIINDKISYDYGVTFSTLSSLTSLTYGGIIISNDSTYMLAQNNDVFYLSINSGATFTDITSRLSW